MYLVGGLVDASGHILVPGIYDHVAPLTAEEKKMYEAVDLDLEEYRNSSQVKTFLFDTKVCPQDEGCLTAPVSQCGLTVLRVCTSQHPKQLFILGQVFTFTAPSPPSRSSRP